VLCKKKVGGGHAVPRDGASLSEKKKDKKSWSKRFRAQTDEEKAEEGSLFTVQKKGESRTAAPFYEKHLPRND